MSKIVVNSITHSGNSGTDNLALDNSGNVKLSAAIQDSSGNNSSTPDEIAEGRAKAWVNFKGTGDVTIRQSFNVSSITDTNVGKYVINYTNNLANDDACLVHGGARQDSNFKIYHDTDITQSASQSSIRTTYDWSGGGNTHNDLPRVFCAIFNVV